MFPSLNAAGGIGAWGTASGNTLPIDGNTLLLAWLVNLPQLILSMCYLALNNICTFLATAEEWNNFALTRKGLRVSRPVGEQRSTYFLQLPYRLAIPLMITSGTLHWLLSQSFFLVRVDFFQRDSDTSSGESISACGFSSFSLLIFFVLGFLMLCAIAWLLARRMQQRMPIAASCSLVISAACHPVKDEIDVHIKKIRWGVTQQLGAGNIQHCAFSANSVKKPGVGSLYR
jgi:hypothetical protein